MKKRIRKMYSLTKKTPQPQVLQVIFIIKCNFDMKLLSSAVVLFTNVYIRSLINDSYSFVYE